MKPYYLFANEGDSLKIEKEREMYAIVVDGEYKPRYNKEDLIKKLKDFIEWVEKYDK